MAKTKTEMFTLIGANLPDNTTGAITPAKLREDYRQYIIRSDKDIPNEGFDL